MSDGLKPSVIINKYFKKYQFKCEQFVIVWKYDEGSFIWKYWHYNLAKFLLKSLKPFWGKVIFLIDIYICVCVCVYIYIYIYAGK
jgi:hypothetical protein